MTRLSIRCLHFVALALVLTIPACATSPSGNGSARRVRSAGPLDRQPQPDSTTTTTTGPTTTTTAVPTTTPGPAPTAVATVAGADPVGLPGVFAVGDSVMLGAARQLRAKGITVDAAESRQWSTGTSILAMLAASHRLPRVVVVHLGTNGPITAGQLDAMLRVLVGHRVLFLNAHEPRWWQQQVNDTLRAGVARWPGTTLLDWDAAGAAHPEWFWNDRIHLRPLGAQGYADLVATAVA